VFVRRDGTSFLTIVSPDPEADFDDLPLDPDFSLFEDRIWPTLAARIPAFEQLRIKRAWAGYYEFNPLDHNGLVGSTAIANLYVAAGFSGHGLMHCAGVGCGIAELMNGGAYSTIDLHPLRPSRFADGEPVREEAVY
jgi:glycine/D-amino acid oxidase-like deaminating enzyme